MAANAQEPIAFWGGVFAAALQLKPSQDPLRSWVQRTGGTVRCRQSFGLVLLTTPLYGRYTISALRAFNLYATQTPSQQDTPSMNDRNGQWPPQ